MTWFQGLRMMFYFITPNESSFATPKEVPDYLDKVSTHERRSQTAHMQGIQTQSRINPNPYPNSNTKNAEAIVHIRS